MSQPSNDSYEVTVGGICDAMHRTEDSRPDLEEPWILSLDGRNEIRETKNSSGVSDLHVVHRHLQRIPRAASHQSLDETPTANRLLKSRSPSPRSLKL